EHEVQEERHIAVILDDQHTRVGAFDDVFGWKRLPFWNFKVKGRANAFARIKSNRAVVLFDNCLDDRKPQARAALLARIGRVRLCEFLENALFEFLWNARTMIADGDTDTLPHAANADFHLTVGR